MHSSVYLSFVGQLLSSQQTFNDYFLWAGKPSAMVLDMPSKVSDLLELIL